MDLFMGSYSNFSKLNFIKKGKIWRAQHYTKLHSCSVSLLHETSKHFRAPPPARNSILATLLLQCFEMLR